ncbi:hypothetical protein FA95DRAFT_1481422 [Auriscalpium vulgare]|uniref:Uncharacterized protein n=1 Tax=Auriscalpium vulgare TaxID=40419 RepID=A0ACB8SBY1_9AGAM|nr:hypothetical protein FA95DRAFT_1481422 [Auriscalpium vulgare]
MAASISEPFALSSYDVSKRFAYGKYAENKPASLFVTHDHGGGAKEGYATVAVPGDGVHVLDISDLHLASSYALGPSTSFSCPAVSRSGTEDGVSVRKTYAVVALSPEVPEEESGRTIWVWTDTTPESGSVQEKKSVVVAHKVSHLYAPKGVLDLILLSPNGDVTVASSDLSELSTDPCPHANASVVKAFAFPPSSATFSRPTSTTLVLFLAIGDQLRIRVLAVDEATLSLLDEALEVEDANIHDVSCCPAGYVSVLGRSGLWSSWQLQVVESKTTIRAKNSQVRLAHMSSTARKSHGVSILSLGSSFVLLTSVTHHNPEFFVLLWDLQYSVVLATHTFPIPTTLTHAKDGIHLELISASSSQALLAISPKQSESASTCRSSVLVLPFQVPKTSTIANAMGRAASSSKWIQAQPTDGPQGGLDSDRQAVLQAVKSAMQQKRPEAADAAFLKWATPVVGVVQLSPDSAEFMILQDDAKLSYEFVRQLLAIFLPSAIPSTPYSAKVVHLLLEQKAVSSGMVEAGILPALLERRDWRGAWLAVNTVVDIPEAHVMAAIRQVVLSHRGQQQPVAADPDAMEVDTASADQPPLSLLLECLHYAFTPAPMRLALRQQIPEAENLTALLAILVGWLDKDTDNLDLGLESIVSKEQVQSTTERRILSFIRLLLDASFLTLLQYPPSHTLLRQVSTRIEPELALLEEMESLRGPLASYAKTHADAVAKAALPPEAKIQQIQQVDWRQRRKAAHEQATMGIGLYQVEEITI